MKLSLRKVLCLSVLMSTFCSFNVFAKTQINPRPQLKMAPVVSQDLPPEQIQDNFQEQNFENPEDIAYLDQEIPQQNNESDFVEAPPVKTEINSAQLGEAQYDVENEFQNQ